MRPEGGFHVLGAGRSRAADDPVPTGAGAPARHRAGDCRVARRVVGRVVGSVDEVHLSGRGGDEVEDGPVEPDGAGGEHHDPLAERGHVLGLVRGEQHRCAGPDAGQGATQRGALGRVKASGRLVQDEHAGIAEQCLGERDPAPLPA